MWKVYLRPRVLKLLRQVGLVPLAYRLVAIGDLRRRARKLGLLIEVAQDGSITVVDRGSRGDAPRAVRLAARHTPYAYDVVVCFDYSHDAVEPELVNGMQLVDYSSSRLHRLRPSGDLFRFTGLAEAEATTQVYLHHAQLQPGDLVLDLGAYCGASTVAFARAVGPTGHVFAMEPDPANAAALRENLERHGVANVTVCQAGVWSETTSLPFVAEGNMGSAVGVVLARGAPTGTVSVLSLADAAQQACEASGASRVAFIKMDIEGAELEALRTGASVLREHQPRLAIEPHAVASVRSTTDTTRIRILDLLGTCDYQWVLSTQGTGSHTLVMASPRR